MLCNTCATGAKTVDTHPEYCPHIDELHYIGESEAVCDSYRKLGEDKNMTLNDRGKREAFKGGGLREPSAGKGRFDLISPVMLIRLAQHYENGADKYETRNWEKGLPMSRCFDSCIRHLYRWLEGDSSEDHLAAAIWNIAALMHYEKYLPKDSPFRDINMPWRGTQKDTTQYRFPKTEGGITDEDI